VSGARKAQVLTDRFGEKGFDYCGNHRVDLAVWKHARGAIVVNASTALQALAATVAEVVATFNQPANLPKAILKALRVHQWAKNGLIFVPVVAAHQLGHAPTLLSTLLAFIAFSLCASSVYLLNDMLDLEADRQHHSKCKRPFASGQLSVLFGLIGAPSLLLGAFGLAAALLPLKFVVYWPCITSPLFCIHSG
jgi:hypothetical protein